jgi:hypothetical protein
VGEWAAGCRERCAAGGGCGGTEGGGAEVDGGLSAVVPWDLAAYALPQLALGVPIAHVKAAGYASDMLKQAMGKAPSHYQETLSK